MRTAVIAGFGVRPPLGGPAGRGAGMLAMEHGVLNGTQIRGHDTVTAL